MPSCNVFCERPVARVAVQKKSAKPKANFQDAYQQGFEAGYKAGLLKAEFEAVKQREQASAQLKEWTQKIQNVHEELFKLALSHLPQLVLAAFSRVLAQHRFTDEEIIKEIEGLLKDLSLAKSVTIECSQEDLEMLKERLDGDNVSLTQSEVKWAVNNSFQKGEYVIQSDLGVLDGRRTTKVAHLHASLQQVL